MDSIILASSSERRIFLLKQIGLDFIAANHKLIEEPQFNSSREVKSVADFVQNLALKKAESLQDDYPESFIIGSDTLIYLNGKVYGKPKDFKDAFGIIRELSGKTHEVYTGVSLINKFKNIYKIAYDKTFVKIKMLNNIGIAEYIHGHPPFDKAGSYGIQDENGIVDSYRGSFENVMGLPVQKLSVLLGEHRLI